MTAELSRRLARAMNTLISTNAVDLATQHELTRALADQDANHLSDYPPWVVDLITAAEQGS